MGGPTDAWLLPESLKVGCARSRRGGPRLRPRWLLSSRGRVSPTRAVRVPTRSVCFLLCWVPALGGMLLSEEAPLNYFLPIVTFPALSSRSSRKVINHPGPATPPRQALRRGRARRCAPKPARWEILARPHSRSHLPRKQRPKPTEVVRTLGLHPVHAQTSPSKSYLYRGEARKHPEGGRGRGCFIDFSLFPSPGARGTVGRGSERAISLSRPLRAAENRGRPVGWSVVEGVGGIT